MAFIKTIRANTASGEVLDMYRRQEQHWGYVPNYSKVFSHRPEVLARWGRLLTEIRRPMDDRRFELVTFVVARELRHSSCSLAHGSKLADIIGEENVIAIAQGRRTDALTDAELAMMAFARDIARDAGRITSGQVEALKTNHGLSDDEVFDIAATASARCFFTKILDALGCEPDVSFLSVNRELRDVLSKGRPISHERSEFTTSRAAASRRAIAAVNQ
jgi:uncharacterized peroxidase-related enzyme